MVSLSLGNELVSLLGPADKVCVIKFAQVMQIRARDSGTVCDDELSLLFQVSCRTRLALRRAGLPYGPRRVEAFGPPTVEHGYSLQHVQTREHRGTRSYSCCLRSPCVLPWP